MPVHVSWYDPDQTILYYQIEKIWKPEDLFAAMQTGREMMAAVDHPVDSIFDLSDALTVPREMLTSLNMLDRTLPQNLRYTIAIGMNAFLNILVETAAKIAPAFMQNFRTAATLEHALALLKEMRAADSSD